MTGAKKGACKNLTGTPMLVEISSHKLVITLHMIQLMRIRKSQQVTLGRNSLLNHHQEINTLKKMLKVSQVMNMKMVRR